ncbi:MAG: sulfatase-like hydrolase/transferase [Planctomycetota bacterium]
MSMRTLAVRAAVFSLALATHVVARGNTAAIPTEPAPLNVLIIVADDVGVDQIGVYESKYPPRPDVPNPCPRPRPCTPRLDLLAKQGLVFTNAWSSPVCSPTRSQLMTGKRTRRSGMGSVTNPERTDLPGLRTTQFSIADLFEHAGAVGKWHLGDECQGPTHPCDLGFESFQGSLYNLADESQDGPAYDDWREWSCSSGTPVHKTTYVTTETTEDAIERMAELRDESTPWVMYVAYNASHSPNHYPPSSPDACKPQSDPFPGCSADGTATPNCQCATDWRATPHCEDPNVPLECRNTTVCQTRAMTQALDAHIAKLLSQVSFCDTAVIFIGDNGTPTIATAYPFVASHAKATLYQGGINVPLIVWVPGMTADAVVDECHALVSATDVFATVADLAQIVPPADSLRDSVSLAQYFPRPESATHSYNLSGAVPRTHVWSQQFNPTFIPDACGNPPATYVAKQHNRAVRNATHKLLEFHDESGVTQQFYRLYNATLPDPDPEEPREPVDPATVPDPYERDDLALTDPEEWNARDVLAYAELQTLMDSTAESPALPIGTSTSVEVTLNASYVHRALRFTSSSPPTTTCSGQTIRVRFDANGTQTYTDRAFMDFVTTSIPDDAVIESVELDVGIHTGASMGVTGVQVKAMPDKAQSIMTPSEGDPNPCPILFDVIQSTEVYKTPVQWTGNGVRKRFDLGFAAAWDLQCRLTDGWFSVGLKLQVEDAVAEDSIQLYNVSGALPHRLHVRYHVP